MKGKLVWYLAAFAGTALMATLGVFVREVSPGNEFAVALGRFSIGWLCLAVFKQLTRTRIRFRGVYPSLNPSPQAERDLTRSPFSACGERGRGIGVNTTKYSRLIFESHQYAPAGRDLAVRLGTRLRRSWALVGSGLMMPLFVVCYFKAVLSGPLANAAFLLYLGPLVASTLAALWLHEGFNRVSGGLLGVALLGTLLITEFRLDSDHLESLVFAFLSGLFYGLFLLLNNPKIQGGGGGLDRIAHQFLVSSLFMIPVVMVTGTNLTRADIPWIVAVGVIHGFVALTLVITALRYLRTVEYSTISYGEPVMAALIGGIAYHEQLSLVQIVGCLLVLVAGMARVLIRDGEPAL